MVKLVATIGLMIGFIELAPSVVPSMMTDTGEATTDTGPEDDTGDAEDTGKAEGTGDSEDTGDAEDTGQPSANDTGTETTKTTKYSASELAGETGGCSATGTHSGLWWMALVALVGVRARRRFPNDAQPYDR